MYNDHSYPVLIKCTFESNYSVNSAGGMYNSYSNPVLSNCTFRSNSADNRGGMDNYYSNPTLSNCVFSDNKAQFRTYPLAPCTGGVCGGMYNDHSDPTLTNCIFERNRAYGIENTGGKGGGMYNTESNPILNNCIFTENEANGGYGLGGGMYNSAGKPWLTNCIFWGNSDDGGMDESAQIYTEGVGGPFINYSCIQGLDTFAGYGNIGEDPCFADSSNDDYHLKSIAGRWDANSESWVQDDVNSPCIDAGDPNSDWTAELWPHGKRINMGAYGDTPQASMSQSDIGNIANLDNDVNDIVNSLDLALLVSKWCYEEFLLAEDLNRDGFVNFDDFAIFGLQWSYPSASAPGIIYQIEDCGGQAAGTSSAEQPDTIRFTVTVEGLYIHFKDVMTANCCPDKLELEMAVEDSLITIYETEYTSAGCRCICSFPITATLGPFEPGSYTLEVYETMGGFIGSTIITIDPAR